MRGKKPSARFLADYAQSETGSEFYLFGGDEDVLSGARVDDLWVLDMAAYRWKLLQRGYHC